MSNTADLFEETVALKATLVASEARNLRKHERVERLDKRVALKQAAVGDERSVTRQSFACKR